MLLPAKFRVREPGRRLAHRRPRADRYRPFNVTPSWSNIVHHAVLSPCHGRFRWVARTVPPERRSQDHITRLDSAVIESCTSPSSSN